MAGPSEKMFRAKSTELLQQKEVIRKHEKLDLHVGQSLRKEKKNKNKGSLYHASIVVMCGRRYVTCDT